MDVGTASARARRGQVRALSVAPMMDRTDRNLRWFLRQLTRDTLLYTEMVTTGAILRGRRLDLLQFSPVEKPLALQLGGDDPRALAACAKIAADLGYDEVNLNVGCPSDKVQRGRFGACLMAEPALVGDCVAAMRAVVDLPVTVKHRIGIDAIDAYEDMRRFVDIVAEAGSDRFSVHARKAWLNGLSPKDNRTIPPLRYAEVYRLKAERPDLAIEINGGIRTLEVAKQQLAHVDAVMIGRAAYENPWVLAHADTHIFGRATDPVLCRSDAVRLAAGYVAARAIRLHQLGRHIVELWHGEPHSRRWKHGLATAAHATGLDAARALEQLAALMEQSHAPHDAVPTLAAIALPHALSPEHP